MSYHGYIYITLNQQTKLDYVGQKFGLPEDTQTYLGSGTKFQQIVKQYGKQFFKKRVLGCLSADTKKELRALLNEAEAECIYFFRTYGSDGEHLDEVYGYNLIKDSRCSRLGIPCPPEVKEKQRISGTIAQNRPDIKKKKSENSALNWTKPEYRAKQYKAQRLVRGTPEARRRNSETQKNAQNRSEVKIKRSGKNHYRYRHDLDNKVSIMHQLKESGISCDNIAILFECSRSHVYKCLTQ